MTGTDVAVAGVKYRLTGDVTGFVDAAWHGAGVMGWL